MNLRSIIAGILALIALQLPVASLAGGEPPSNEEMWRMIQSQQAEIEALKRRLEDTDQKAEAAVVAVDAASSTRQKSSWAEKTHIGGYGETTF